MLKIFSQEDFALKSKLWPPSFLLHRLRWFFFSRNKGQLRPAVTWPCRLPTPLCHTYSEPSGHEDSSGTTQYLSYLFKILSKLRLSDPFFGYFVSILSSEVEIAYQNSDIWKSKITWSAIDIDKNGFITPFLTLTPISPQHQQLRHIRHTLTHTSSYFMFLWY